MPHAVTSHARTFDADLHGAAQVNHFMLLLRTFVFVIVVPGRVFVVVEPGPFTVDVTVDTLETVTVGPDKMCQ